MMLCTSMHSQNLLKKQKDNFEKPRNYLMNNSLINISINSNTTVKANPMGMLLNTSASTVEWTVAAIYVEQYWQQTRTGKEMRRIKGAPVDFPWHNHNPVSAIGMCSFNMW